MSTWYDVPMGTFSLEVNSIRQRLISADVVALSDARSRVLAGEVKAFAYVWLAACLESCLKGMLSGLIRELNTRALTINRLQPGLLGLLFDPDLESIRDLKDHEKLWNRRCNLFQNTLAGAVAVFNPAILPLDGRTIRPYHLNVIWDIFGFTGISVPHPLHRLALTDLADGRNDIAHGEISPAIFGRRKSTPDVRKLIDRIEEIIIYFTVSADTYLLRGGYYK